ncbi:ribonuclease H1/H2 small subunit [Opisthorchis viverrini]|uniref:Ribonuclease H1/H2 small subunit n=1 Tax=Opisthorchis viverrini TaxID=6198 RepID=A0A1S8WZE0_OPIVI|nr:ribonuclease H1/H2 small subunit [Opisthorchis viverrini]
MDVRTIAPFYNGDDVLKQVMEAHLLPCKISSDGMHVDVQAGFVREETGSISFSGHSVEKANFRGRPIFGTKLPIPPPYEAVLAHPTDSLGDKEPARLSVKSKISSITLWNLSDEPKASDKIPLAMLWLKLAPLVHSNASYSN